MWFLALRHLTSRKKQTLLTLLGILLGTAAYVAISGMMLGFQTFIVDQLVNNDSHVRINPREEWITPASSRDILYGEQNAVINWHSPPAGRRDNNFIAHPHGWFSRLDLDHGVAAYSPQLVIQALARRGQLNTGVRFIGCDPQRQLGVTNIEKYMVEGRFQDMGNTGNRVVVGQGLLRRLGANTGETLLLSSGTGLPQPFRIVGTFRLGVKTLDDGVIFGALSDVQKLNSTPSRISDIAIKLTDVAKAGETASRWSFLSEDKVQSWDQANEGIMSVFTTQDVVRNAMTISILLVAGFGIYNILNMAVNQKRREIAILRSMGYLPKDILQLFFLQGLILGIIGGLVGLLLGYLASLYMATIEVSADRGLGGNRMLVSFLPSIYIKGFALAFFSSAIASLLPARAAGKLEPIEIIRNEDV